MKKIWKRLTWYLIWSVFLICHASVYVLISCGDVSFHFLMIHILSIFSWAFRLFFYLLQGFTVYNPQGKSGSPPIFVNSFLEHSHTHLCVICGGSHV